MIVGFKSLTIFIISFIKGYSKETFVSSSTRHSMISLFSIAAAAASL